MRTTVTPWTDPDVRTAFARDGAVHIPGAVPASYLDAAREGIEASRLAPSEHYAMLSRPGHGAVDSDLFRWFDIAPLRQVLFDSPLPAVAGHLLDCDDLVLVEDQWFASAPGADTPSPWHQDEPYYNIAGEFLTLWLALDDAPAGAALTVVAGSHRWGRTFAPVEFVAEGTTIDGDGGLEALTDEVLAMTEPLSWDVQAGDLIALHPLTLHSAGSVAVADRWFRRLSTRWASPAARYLDRGDQAASFWRKLPHGLTSGDPLVCETFPLVASLRP